jgi:hypothetical protein
MKKSLAVLMTVFATLAWVGPLPEPIVSRAAAEQQPVKMSKSGICHAPGSTYYDRTKHFVSFANLDACLKAGGRLPKR